MKARLWKQGMLQAQVTVPDETLRGDLYHRVLSVPLSAGPTDDERFSPQFPQEEYRCIAVGHPTWRDGGADFLFVREKA